MKLILIFFSLVLFGNVAYSQTSGFDFSNGKWMEHTTPPNTATLIGKEALEKELIKRVKATLNNLEDDSLYLQQQYESIFFFGKKGSFFYCFRDEMKQVLSVLQSGHWLDPCCEVNDREFFPNDDFFKKIKNLPRYHKKPDDALILLERLPVRYFLDMLYKDVNYSDISNSDMDMDYIKEWRQIEVWYARNNQLLDSLSKASGTISDCNKLDIINNFIASVKVNCIDTQVNYNDSCCGKKVTTHSRQTIIGWLNNPKGIMKWLWLTGGIITANPLVFTTDDRAYPAKEKQTIKDTLAYKDTHPDAIGNQKLMTEFRTTSKVHNKVIKQGNSGVYYSKESFDTEPKKLKGGTEKWINRVALKDEKVEIVVHNVAPTDSFQFVRNAKTLDDATAISQQIANISDAFPALNLFNSLGLLAGFIPELNNTTLRKVWNNSSTISDVQAKNKVADMLKNATEFTKLNTQSIYAISQNAGEYFDSKSFKVTALQTQPSKEIDGIRINGRYIIYKKDKDYQADKKDVLMAKLSYPAGNCKLCQDSIPNFFVDSFLVKDYCHILDYSTEAINLDSIESMMKRLSCFYQNVRICDSLINLSIATLKSNQAKLLSLLSIANRNLPPNPKLLGSQPDAAPAALQTQVFKETFTDTSLSISVAFTQVKGGKADDDAKGLWKIKVGKRHYLEASAGLACTLQPYYITDDAPNGTTPPPFTSLGDKFQLNAGLHIYPWGLIRTDNRLLFPPGNRWANRLSAYIGVTVKQPLNNFLAGVSYDLIPGLRLISGLHFYKRNVYRIVNNAVFDQAYAYRLGGAFISLNLEPTTLIKTLKIIK